MPERLLYDLFLTGGHLDLPADPAWTQPRRRIEVLGLSGGLAKRQPIGRMGIPRGRGAADPELPAHSHDVSAPCVPAPRIDLEAGDELIITVTDLRQNPEIHSEESLDLYVNPGNIKIAPLRLRGRENTRLYKLRPNRPGTFVYCLSTLPFWQHDFVDTAGEDVQWLTYGALVVYPSYRGLARAGVVKCPRTGLWYHNGEAQTQISADASNRNFAFDDVRTYCDSDRFLLFSSIRGRESPEGTSFKLVNGRSFPDTLLPAQIPPHLRHAFGYDIAPGYETYIRLVPRSPEEPTKVLLRTFNLCSDSVLFHAGGLPAQALSGGAIAAGSNQVVRTRVSGDSTIIYPGSSQDFLLTMGPEFHSDHSQSERADLPRPESEVLALSRAFRSVIVPPPIRELVEKWASVMSSAWKEHAPDPENCPQCFLACIDEDSPAPGILLSPEGRIVPIQISGPEPEVKTLPAAGAEQDSLEAATAGPSSGLHTPGAPWNRFRSLAAKLRKRVRTGMGARKRGRVRDRKGRLRLRLRDSKAIASINIVPKGLPGDLTETIGDVLERGLRRVKRNRGVYVPGLIFYLIFTDYVNIQGDAKPDSQE